MKTAPLGRCRLFCLWEFLHGGRDKGVARRVCLGGCQSDAGRVEIMLESIETR